jgi:hypothetical protein
MKYLRLIIIVLLCGFLFLLNSCDTWKKCVVSCCNGRNTTTYTDLSRSDCQYAAEEASDELNCDCDYEWGD